MSNQFKALREHIIEFYGREGRPMPWREPDESGAFDPYKILVSELMLQQTQVNRVIDKFNEFITEFPTIETLAEADLQQVLRLWNGLGYNRRAKYLHDIAKELASKPFPTTIERLTELKGIGNNTAAAVLVYTYDQRHVFVETNVRTVVLHHFFADSDKISDKQVAEKLEQLLPDENYREFYWGLMDYGTYLKSQGIRNNAQSKHYTKQSTFEGSLRQVRGRVIACLAESNNGYAVDNLQELVHDERLGQVLHDLTAEGLISLNSGRYTIA